MKVSPVSGDFLVKAGLVSLAVGGLAYMAWKKRDLINPLSRDNAAYSGVNAIGAALATAPDAPGKNADGSWSLGGWVYDLTHPGTVRDLKAMKGPTVGQVDPALIDYSQYHGGA